MDWGQILQDGINTVLGIVDDAFLGDEERYKLDLDAERQKRAEDRAAEFQREQMRFQQSLVVGGVVVVAIIGAVYIAGRSIKA